MGGRRQSAGTFAVALAVSVIACAPPPRDQVDAGADANQELCGNGVVDSVREEGYLEDCDQGALNGTPAGRCTKQCDPAIVPLRQPTGYVDLGIPIAKLEMLERDTEGRIRMAVTNFDARGIQVFRSVLDLNGPNPRPAMTSLIVQSAPVAFGRVQPGPLAQFLPAWVEMPAGESPRLYYAESPEVGTPVIHEIPYPFPDGTRPEIVGRSYEDPGLLIIDQSSTGPRDLLIAWVIVRSPTDVQTVTRRIPAPAGTRNVAIDTGRYYDNVDRRYGARQVVQFFDDPGTFVAIDLRLTPDDPFATTASAELQEVARGSWPYHVVGGSAFLKSCTDVAWPWHPVPLVVVTETGELFAWQFDRGVDAGEAFLTPFGRAATGTSNIVAGSSGAVALEPDGRIARFTDGDCRDLRSTALAPLRGPYTQPWSVSTLPGWQSTSQLEWSATADSILYLE